jgi:hypothetical protein
MSCWVSRRVVRASPAGAFERGSIEGHLSRAIPVGKRQVVPPPVSCLTLRSRARNVCA